MLNTGIFVYDASKYNVRHELAIRLKPPDISLEKYLISEIFWQITGWKILPIHSVNLNNNEYRVSFLVGDSKDRPIFGISEDDSHKIFVFDNEIVDSLLLSLKGFIFDGCIIVGKTCS